MGSMGLNAGPPLPPNLQPQPPQQSVGALAGQAPDQSATPGGSASLQQQVIQNMMTAEQALQAVQGMLPESQGGLDKAIQIMRQTMTPILQKGVQAPAPVTSGGLMSALSAMQG